MMRFVDKFFSGAVGDSEPSSPEASLKHAADFKESDSVSPENPDTSL